MNDPRVTIIIPTTCRSDRAALLRRALASVFSTATVRPRVLVVVNGESYDPVLYEELRQDSRIHVIYERIGSLPRALKIGRQAVETEFFGFLDDDDEYINKAIDARLSILERDRDTDVVVSNGLRIAENKEREFLTNFSSTQTDPLESLTRSNWLASCGATYRSARITQDYFDERFKYLEWTLLAFKIAHNRSIAFDHEYRFKIYDTPNSLSKSKAYEISQLGVLEEIAKLPLPPKVQKSVQKKISAAHHSLADHYLHTEERKKAWRHHIASLTLTGGLRYLSFTRRLFR